MVFRKNGWVSLPAEMAFVQPRQEEAEPGQLQPKQVFAAYP